MAFELFRAIASRNALALLSSALASQSPLPPSESPVQGNVFAAFPEANGCQVIVRDVTAAARARIEALLPFPVHLGELGQHSLYVAVRDRQPIGMVHARSEEGEFGLLTIEWAIAIDRRLTGFRITRSRGVVRQQLEHSGFARSLVGCARADLDARVDGNGRLKQLEGIPPGAEAAATAITRSALKTLAVLDVIWAAELDKLQDLALGLQAFPHAVSCRRVWPPPLSEPPARKPAPHGAATNHAPVLRIAVRALGIESRELGLVAEVALAFGRDTTTVRWTLDDQQQIVAVEVPADAPAAVKAACKKTWGKPLQAIAARADPIGQAAQLLWNLAATDQPRGR